MRYPRNNAPMKTAAIATVTKAMSAVSSRLRGRGSVEMKTLEWHHRFKKKQVWRKFSTKKSDRLTCLSAVTPTRLHQLQGGGVGCGWGLGEVGVAEVSAAAAESVAAVLDLDFGFWRCRRHKATIAMTLLLVSNLSPTTWTKKYGSVWTQRSLSLTVQGFHCCFLWL